MLFSKPALITKALVGAAICFTSVPAAAAACQPGEAGCVLPVLDAPPAALPAATSAPLLADEPRLGLLPILAGLALAGLVLFLLLDDDDDEDAPVSP